MLIQEVFDLLLCLDLLKTLQFALSLELFNLSSLLFFEEEGHFSSRAIFTPVLIEFHIFYPTVNGMVLKLFCLIQYNLSQLEGDALHTMA